MRGVKNLRQQESFELLGGVLDFGGAVGGGRQRGAGERLRGRQLAQRIRRVGRTHQITSISASSAPAERRACRMAMMSRGVEPMAASARQSSSTVAPCFSTMLRAFSSLAPTVVCGTTSVVPCESGPGCDTARLVWISTFRLPCRMATGATRTSLPRTMVPVRSLTITRAGRSASTVRFSSSERNSVVRDAKGAGMDTLTRPEFSARAAGASLAPNFWLMAATIRVEVVKSDWRNCRRTVALGATEGAGRSTVAPLGARPTVGWLTVWLERGVQDRDV